MKIHKLRGWDNSIRNDAARIAGELRSSRPYAQFSIIGERRSGRSTYFQYLAQHMNSAEEYSSDFIVLAGDLETDNYKNLATAFHEALVRSVAVSGVGGAEKCTLSEKELIQTDALFLLASKIIENLKRTPVFLIDMGAVLESADMGSILKLSRSYLKLIANRAEDRNIPFALGLGWTEKFFEQAVVIAGDVFRDRYRARRTLGNSFESEEPFKVFSSIVKDIAGADVPHRFTGLLRVPGLTAGMYGENLRGLKVKGEVSPELTWEALRANDWKIIPQLNYPETENLTSADLAELLLADGRLPGNLCPGYLEPTAPDAFGANDKLYERFGLLPPRRDPTVLERFRNRLNDPEDSALVEEMTHSIARVLKDVCHAESLETTLFSGRSAIVATSLRELPPPLGDEKQGAPEFDQNIDSKVLPRRLTIGIYLDSPDTQEFEQAMRDALKRGDFLIVCHPQGVLQAISETEIFRTAKNEGLPYFKAEATEHDLCTLANRGSDTTPCDELIVSWTNCCLSEHLKRRPAIPLLSETGKKALSAIIAGAGRLKEDDLKTNLSLSKAACSGLIGRLNEAEIISKKKGVLYWDPAQDPVLGALLVAGEDTQELISQLGGKFTLSDGPFDPQNFLAAYSGVFQGTELGNIKEGDLLTWYEAHRPQLLNVVFNLIESEKELTALNDRAQALKLKQLDDWQDISGDRLEIDTLLTEANENIEKNKVSRENAAKELHQVKESLKRSVQENAAYFAESDREEMLNQIDGFRTAESSSITQLRKKIEKRVKELDTTREALFATKIHLQELKSEPKSQFNPALAELTRQVDELSNLTDLAEISPKLAELNKAVDGLERKVLRAAIVTINKSSVRPPTDSYRSGDQSAPVPPPIQPQGKGPILPPPPSKTGRAASSVLPPLPSGSGNGNPSAPPMQTTDLVIRETPPEEETKLIASEDKEQTFDISQSEQARQLAFMLLNPRVEIKKIRALF